MKIFKMTREAQAVASTISARCPSCRHAVLFRPPHIGGYHDFGFATGGQVGVRVCPRSECLAVVFVGHDVNEGWSFLPPELIEFDTGHIPPTIVKTLEEAINCHATECYRAAAIMIRRTLEDLCHEQNATGGTLYARIEDLATKVVLPTAFVAGLHHLRLLGNDAAHIEAQVYAQVSEQEVSVGLAVTIEILKATYQTQSLVDQLQALQQPPAP